MKVGRKVGNGKKRMKGRNRKGRRGEGKEREGRESGKRGE